VYVVEDIERILSALAGAARRYGGEYGSGYMDALRDVAAGVGGTVDGVDRVDVVREVVEYRHERTVERYQAAPPPTIPERRFAIRGEREEWPAVEQYRTQPALAMTDAEFHDFVPGKGEVRRMESGWMWRGSDGSKVFYPVQQWVEIAADDARRLGYLIADNRTFVLAVRSLAEARMRRLGQSVRVLPTERRQLR
jgi:hypothetical protein